MLPSRLHSPRLLRLPPVSTLRTYMVGERAGDVVHPRIAGSVNDDVVELLCGGGRGHPGASTAGLKRKLDLYFAAVAKSMEAKSQESSFGYSDSLASGTSQLTFQASFDVEQTGDGGGASLVTNSNVIHTGHDDYQGKPTNSGTSKQQSDCGVNLDEKSDPAIAKKMRRMMLNRESARRSRKRRESRLRDLESQVSTLTSENASLLKRMEDMTHKYKDATLDNRNLIIAVETMRTKSTLHDDQNKPALSQMQQFPLTSGELGTMLVSL
ncbi:hypothetical protein PVAP13_8KG164700 [Panicum virgatum]|uniref:BZIP domain-containing protein n=1 Tax=Panicum virgatum TaxID=38727 RepID=A0A8T0PLN3_PANVG|nr:hypothetical protein PVAP13_8KG164700 [Panicum virgatum]